MKKFRCIICKGDCEKSPEDLENLPVLMPLFVYLWTSLIYTRDICFYCVFGIWGGKLYTSRYFFIQGIDIYSWIWLKIIFFSGNLIDNIPRQFWRVEEGNFLQSFSDICKSDGRINVTGERSSLVFITGSTEQTVGFASNLTHKMQR